MTRSSCASASPSPSGGIDAAVLAARFSPFVLLRNQLRSFSEFLSASNQNGAPSASRIHESANFFVSSTPQVRGSGGGSNVVFESP